MLGIAGTAPPKRTSNLVMNRRSFLVAVVVSPVVRCTCRVRRPRARCPSPRSRRLCRPCRLLPTGPTSAPVAGIVHPTGADDVVLRLAYEGGLVPAGYAFVSTPSLLVSGDGRVFTPGIIPAIFPGPLLPAVMVRTLTEDGMQAMLGVVRDAGLLAAATRVPRSAQRRRCAQHGADDQRRRGHVRALRLRPRHGRRSGDRRAPEPARRDHEARRCRGDGRCGQPRGRPAVHSDHLPVPGQGDRSRRAHRPTAGAVGRGVARTTGVSRSPATTCARVDAAAVGSLFLDAKQNTYFKDGDVVYQLAVAGVLPGDPEC